MRPLVSLSIAVTLLLGTAMLAKKKNKEEVTQVLELPPDPPSAVSAEVRRMVFHTSPISTHGLLSQQTKDAVRAILRESGGMQPVKLRAFVAGAGDLRRVPQIVSEEFSDHKHMQLPAISVVQAGGLPVEGAQVVIEAVSEAKREVNPNGLLFVSAQESSVNQPLQPLVPLAEKSLGELSAKIGGRGEALRVTCFATMLDDAPRIQAAMSARFPNAALDLVQTQRAPARSSVACEAVARALSAPARNVAGVAEVNGGRIVLTGTQVAYGFAEDDARLAFRRLDRVLAPFGASMRQAVRMDVYPLSASIARQVERVSPEFLDAAHPPAKSVVQFEGLPGMDSSFAVELAASTPQP